MKKFIAVISLILAAAFLSTASIAADIPTLPKIKGWKCGELKQTKFNTVSGYRGQWLEREYRTNEGVPIHAIWIDGAGPKGWEVPDENSNTHKGYMPPQATYKTLKVAGHRAAFEQDQMMGISLAIRLPNGVLTLESLMATEAEAISAAEIILEQME